MWRVYAWLLTLALLACGGWYLHHRVYQSGYNAAHAADKKAVDDAADANEAMKRVLAVAENAAAECVAGREADQDAARRAADAAKSEREAIQRRANDANKRLADLMAGECKAWAELPACGSMQ